MRYCYGNSFGEIDSLPGCSQVAVSHSVFVPIGARGKGNGSVGHKARLGQMRALGYDYGVCTADVENIAQIKILEKNGWKRLDVFSSSKTGHKVALYGKVL